MANLNLSEFTEKLFVADADHTFIWDTAASISKRVSRNSWLNSGTLTSDAPVTISQTWNGTGSTVFKALVVNATTPGTTSSSSSLLLDLQVGGVSKVSVDKTSVCRFSNNGIFFDAFGADTSGFQYIGQEQLVVSRGLNGSKRVLLNNVGVFVGNASAFGFASTGEANATADTLLVRDSPSGNTLALRNGAAAQTFRIYNTTDTGVTTYERAALGFSSNVFRIVTENLAGVTAPRDICLNSGTGTTQIAGNGISTLMSFPISFGGTNTGTLGYTGGAFRVGTVLASPCDFLTSNLVRVRINDAGNVGIGTTAPGAKLQVVGNAIFGENNSQLTATPVNVSFGGTYGSSTPGSKANLKWDLYRDFGGDRSGIGISAGLVEFQGGVGAGFGFYPNNTTVSALHIIPSGNVGIGTTSPTSKLQVSAGDVEVDTIAKGVILKSPDGTRYRVTVANGGTLSVAAV